MAAKKHPRPDLSEADRQQRQDEVYRLHCRGWTFRAIGAELGLDCSQVNRALQQAKAAIVAQKGAEHLADLADRIAEGAWEDLADSWRVSSLEPVEVTEEDPVTGGLTKVRILAPDFKALALERSARAKLRDQIAKAYGLDPARAAELELRRQAQQQTLDLEKQKSEQRAAEAKKSGDLLQLLADGLLCTPPTGPSTEEPTA